jgi:hypothetical protein
MNISIEKQLVKHVNNWANEFQKSIISNAYENYSFLIGVEGENKKSKKISSFLQKSIERQIVFIKYFSHCRLLENHSKANLTSVKRLISSQHIDSSVIKKIPQYEVFFYFSKGRKVFLFVDDLAEIDFADIYSATYFEAISISNHSWKYLTKTALNSTLKVIHDDMAYDHYNINFGIPDQYAPGKNNAIIYAACNVEKIPAPRNDFTEYCEKIMGTSEIDIDKIAKIQKANELFGIDVLKWFKP